MVQHNAPLYDELMLGRAYNLANYLTADNADIKESALMKHKVLAAIYNAAEHMKGQTPEREKSRFRARCLCQRRLSCLAAFWMQRQRKRTAAIKVPPDLKDWRICMIRFRKIPLAIGL